MRSDASAKLGRETSIAELRFPSVLRQTSKQDSTASVSIMKGSLVPQIVGICRKPQMVANPQDAIS